jgi:hypothetical protein
MFEKGMLVAIEEFFAFDQEGRHPSRIVGVNAPRKFDEDIPFRARSNLHYFYLPHSDFDFSGGRLRCKTEMTLR